MPIWLMAQIPTDNQVRTTASDGSLIQGHGKPIPPPEAARNRNTGTILARLAPCSGTTTINGKMAVY